MQEISEVRGAIDALDDELVALLARRFQLTCRVGELKAELGEAAISLERQAQRRALLNALAHKHGVDGALLSDVFARIQRDTVDNHQRLAAERQVRDS